MDSAGIDDFERHKRGTGGRLVGHRADLELRFSGSGDVDGDGHRGPVDLIDFDAGLLGIAVGLNITRASLAGNC